MASLADRLRKSRHEAGLTQEAAAAAIDKTTASLRRWENGEVVPQADDLLRLAHLFDVDPGWLLGGGERPERDDPAVVRLRDIRDSVSVVGEVLRPDGTFPEGWALVDFDKAERFLTARSYRDIEDVVMRDRALVVGDIVMFWSPGCRLVPAHLAREIDRLIEARLPSLMQGPKLSRLWFGRGR